MNIYLIEAFGTGLLSFFAFYLGKPFAHVILGITLLFFDKQTQTNGFNPAISITKFIAKKITGQRLVFFIVAEILGAYLGYLLYRFLESEKII